MRSAAALVASDRTWRPTQMLRSIRCLLLLACLAATCRRECGVGSPPADGANAPAFGGTRWEDANARKSTTNPRVRYAHPTFAARALRFHDGQRMFVVMFCRESRLSSFALWALGTLGRSRRSVPSRRRSAAPSHVAFPKAEAAAAAAAAEAAAAAAAGAGEPWRQLLAEQDFSFWQQQQGQR